MFSPTGISCFLKAKDDNTNSPLPRPLVQLVINVYGGVWSLKAVWHSFRLQLHESDHKTATFALSSRIVYRNDQCNNKYGAGMTVELRDEEDVDAYLGPPCSICKYLSIFSRQPAVTRRFA